MCCEYQSCELVANFLERLKGAPIKALGFRHRAEGNTVVETPAIDQSHDLSSLRV
jgi:hypothetical protein